MNRAFFPSAVRCVLLGFVFGLAVSGSATLVQRTPPVPPADATSPVPIWDFNPKLPDSLPRNFRTTNDPLKATNGKIPPDIGLADLRASGGGEFTAAGLKLLLARTHGPVTIFDLRQETHIFVNGLPISWYATNDWANVGRAQSAIEADEDGRVRALKPGDVITVTGDGVKKSDLAANARENVTVEHASTEHDVVAANKAAYVRVAVTDHARPLDEEVDRFILAVRALPKDGWAHFHCEAGRGRTTTFMVLYDVLRNGTRVSIEDIALRQQQLGYNFDVLGLSDPEDWKAPYTEDRIAFVRAFYRYARANPGGRPQLWSEWLKSDAG